MNETTTPSPVARDAHLDEDTVRSLTILNVSGHSTMAWGPQADEVMREAIERKMAEGYAFFLLERRWLNLLPERRVRVTDVERAMAARRLSMADDLFADIVSSGAVQLVRSPASPSSGTPSATLVRDPGLVARGQAYAVRHPQGG